MAVTLIAVCITRPGGPEVLELTDRPMPMPGEDEVLVRVRAAGLNRADIFQRSTMSGAPVGAPPDVPGLEFSGDVVLCGRNVSSFRVGERVFGLCAGGAHAEYVLARPDTMALIPPNLTYIQAAAVPEAFITATDALFRIARLKPGANVLINAIGSGVGTAALQLAKLAGAKVYGISRTGDKIQQAIELGLAGGVVSGAQGPISATPRLLEMSGDRKFQVAIDLLGGQYSTLAVRILGRFGTLVILGGLAGLEPVIPLRELMLNMLRLEGAVLRHRSRSEAGAAFAAFANIALPLLVDGSIYPIIYSVVPLRAVADAHSLMELNRPFGKIVLEVNPSGGGQ